MILINLLCAVFILHDPHADPEACVCDANRIEGGWCEKCDVGYCAGLRFTSRKLAETIDFHGHQVVAERTACPECRKLIQAGGYCESCRMGFVQRRGYFSRVCYQLAKGKPIHLKRVENNDGDSDVGRNNCCPEDGWCDKCKRGVAGNRLYTDKPDYELTVRSVAVLKRAIETSARCETCAEAMIADSRCSVCRITYKDGRPVKSAAEGDDSSKVKPDTAAKGRDSSDEND